MDSSNTFALPPEMNSILSATIVQTNISDVIVCHDHYFIYAAKVTKNPTTFNFQKFAQASITAVVPIIKNYFMALVGLKKIIIFEVNFTQQGKIILKYNYNKQKPYSSYFIREVVDNMAQLQICYPQNQILIFQFTVNGKVGTMNYSITAQHKLKNCERLQLYGSKTIFSNHRKMIYFFTNFSNKTVNFHNLAKFEQEISAQLGLYPLAYICLPKIQEFYLLTSNFTVLSVPTFTNRHKISCEGSQYEHIQRLSQQLENKEETLNSLKITTYLDLILIQDLTKNIAFTLQLKAKNSQLIGVQYGPINWFWTCSRKLIGLSPNRSQFKIIQSLKINEPIKMIEEPVDLKRKDYTFSFNDPHKKNDFVSYKEFYEQKMKENQQLHMLQIKKLQASNVNENETQGKVVAESFTPLKIIQRNKISISKTLNKSKQIEPISNNSKAVLSQKIAQQKVSPHLQTQKQPPNSLQAPFLDKLTPSFTSLPQAHPSIKRVATIASQQDKEEDDLLKQSNNVVDKSQSAQQQLSNSSQKLINNHEVIQLFIQKEILGIMQQHQSQKKSTQVSQTTTAHNQQVPQPKQQEIEKKDKTETLKDGKQVGDEQKSNESGQQHLPRSLAVLVGKSQLGGQYSHTINLFNTSINRNNIFTSTSNQTPNIFLKKNHSEGDYYNPLLFYSPCSQDKKEAFQFKKESSENKQEQSDKKSESSQKKEEGSSQNIEKPQQKKEEPQQNKEQTLQIKGNQSQKKADFKQIQEKSMEKKVDSSQDKVKALQKKPAQIIVSIEQIQLRKKETFAEMLAIRQKQNSIIIEKLKELFHDTTSKLLKQLQQLAKINEIQPYIRDHVIDEIKLKVFDNLQRQMTGDFTSKIQKYFIELFKQTSEVQQESVKFYKEANNHKCKNLQIHINNQEKILKDIREIESHLRMHVVNLKKQNKECFQELLREWHRQFKESSKIVDGVIGIKSKLQEEKEAQVQKKNDIRNRLSQIKKYLQKKISLKEQKQQKKQQKNLLLKQKRQKSKQIEYKKKSKANDDSKLKKKSRQIEN